MRHLLAPRQTPEGTVSWEETAPDIGRLIRDGDPTCGWLGDPLLSLHLNLAYRTDPENRKPGIPRWEVWRNHGGTEPTFVCSLVAQRLNGELARRLCSILAAHDSRIHDIADEMLAARDRTAESESDTARAEYADKADKLAWALGRDLSLPAQDGRVIRLGGT